MRTTKRAWWLGAALGSLAVGAYVVGCTADGGGPSDTPPSDSQDATLADSPSIPVPDATPLADSGAKPDSATADAGDAGADANDAAVDAGPKPPQPGDPCPVVNGIVTRSCGACGTQQALCELGDAGKGVTGEFGFCDGEVPGGCLPGSVDNVACGLCGTLKRVCQNNCTWAVGACTEPPMACKPDSVRYVTAGCALPDTFRTQVCNATCGWNPPVGACEPPMNANTLTIGANVGDVVSAEYTLDAAQTFQRLSGNCPAASLLSAPDYPYFYVELYNPTAKAATVTVYNTIAAGGTELDTIMWSYGRALAPQDDTEKKACQVGTKTDCTLALCGGTITSRLASLLNVIVPAGRKILVYVSTSSTKTSSLSIGPVGFNVKTEALAP